MEGLFYQNKTSILSASQIGLYVLFCFVLFAGLGIGGDSERAVGTKQVLIRCLGDSVFLITSS